MNQRCLFRMINPATVNAKSVTATIANQSGPFVGPAIELQSRKTIRRRICTCTILTIILNIAHTLIQSGRRQVLRKSLYFRNRLMRRAKVQALADSAAWYESDGQLERPAHAAREVLQNGSRMSVRQGVVIFSVQAIRCHLGRNRNGFVSLPLGKRGLLSCPGK
jgi:hypothetical protein